ncbi:MAG: TetR/AcrR family transcriptional regulator [Candidatus Promineifilaceae bacterium]
MTSSESEQYQRILDAAFDEFAHKGYRGATIKSIGQAAGLKSPSLIYWYFPTKEDLFQKTVRDRQPLVKAVIDADSLLDRPPTEVLPFLAQTYLKSIEEPEMQQMFRLFLAEMGKRPGLADLVSETVVEPVLAFLQSYLARQVKLRRMRPHDERAGARAFIGMLLPQMISMVLFPALYADGPTNEEHLETAIDIYLRGVLIDP